MSVGTAGQEKRCVTVWREKRHSGHKEEVARPYAICRPPKASNGPNEVEKGQPVENEKADAPTSRLAAEGALRLDWGPTSA